ncbi:glycosyl transferase [Shewanella baltica]|uniref:glycosyltransferase n=1 Tax=Shewanella baltica TaxID=62322 RepID=UPI0007B4AF4E|nr:glycosyltransferase [Shewanella baltica]KZK65191.1 glycosyl transferase [Shewanella baltica]
MDDKVCVLLAAYNGAEFIQEQLDSILKQVDVLLDIYVSLDLSNDKTFDIILDYQNRYSNIYFLSYGEKYGSAGKNFFHLLRTVDFSCYDFISFADQDDIWLTHKLSTSIKLIKEFGSDAYSGNVVAFWPNGKRRLIKKDCEQVEFDYLFESAGPGCSFVLKGKLACEIKNTLNEKLEDINNLWLHDWFCYSFARSNGFKWHIGSEPLMLYRQHDNNQVGASKGVGALISRAKVILNGEGFEKVVQQSKFLGQNELPIQLINSGSVLSLLKLASIARNCRRKNSEKILFVFALLLLSIKKVLKA